MDSLVVQGVIYLLAFILAISVLVIAHELGHYSVARFFGVKVLRFAVGFGKVLWSRKRGPDQTEWAICAVPLGGYVKMVDEREGDVAAEDLPRAFSRQTLGKRSLIVLAGPVASILLAWVLYWALFSYGVDELKPLLAKPAAETLAARAGISEGDLVVSIDGQEIISMEDVRWQVLKALVGHRDIQFGVRTQSGGLESRALATHTTSLDSLGRDPMRHLGLMVRMPRLPAVIGEVAEKTPAATAGIRKGDRIVSIDGRPVSLWSEVSGAIVASPGKPMTLTLERDGQPITLTATPAEVKTEAGETRGRLGIGVQNDPSLWEAMRIRRNYSLGAAAYKATAQIWDTAALSLRVIGQMLIGDASLKNLSGPIAIAEVTGKSIQLGFGTFLSVLAFLSLSIGVLNLLPIPVLDGGHLMYYLAEFLRGKPLSERAFETGQRIGLVLLLFVMGIAIFNDLSRFEDLGRKFLQLFG